MSYSRSRSRQNKTVVIFLITCCVLALIIVGVIKLEVLPSSPNPSQTTSPNPSATVTPKPTPIITLTISAEAAKVTSTIRLTATFSQPVNGNVTLQWAVKSSDFTYSINQTVTNGVFTRDFGFDELGKYQFRVVWAGDEFYGSATSNTVSVNVTT